jgi:hypothetical protein
MIRDRSSKHTNFQHSRADGDDIVISALVEDRGISDAAKIRSVALTEPALMSAIESASVNPGGVGGSFSWLQPPLPTEAPRASRP